MGFVFPLIIFGKLNNKKYNIIYSFSSAFVLLWLIKNILISGCLIYPIQKTCINKLFWFDKSETIKQSISAEAWAKDWPNKVDVSISQEDYIKNYNWLSSWSKNHLSYILKILTPYIIFLLTIILFMNLNKKKSIKKIFNRYKNILL